MDYRILGPFEVWAAGRPLSLGGTKQRAVLAMLVLHGDQVVSLDRLVDGLWGEAPPSSAINAVQVYVSRLRKRLHVDHQGSRATAVLHRRPPGYLLELDADELDLHRFERLAREGTHALRAGPELSAAKLSEALGLWRGAPLAEFADCPFAQAEIPRLEEQHLAALEARVEADIALGRHAELVGELEALIARHPLREGLHRQLMLGLYRSGRQAEALEAYRRTRQTLAEELGIDPGRALQELEVAMLAQDRRLDWRPPEPAQTVTGEVTRASERAWCGRVPEVWNVPVRNPHFTGRADLLGELSRRLRAGEDTLVVQALYGLGGVGKTQLAIEYAHRFAADYELAWWVDAEQPALIGAQLATLAGALALPTTRAVPDTVEMVLAELRRRSRWLLIFDNADQPEHLANYRPGGAGHVLVTSRRPGWGAVGGRLEVDVLSRSETVALLQHRILDLDGELADELAAELGDLPLAAAQAAGYLEQTGLPPADYLRRFRTCRDGLLAAGDVLGYQGRVNTTWDLSLDRLEQQSPAAAQLLRLGAFLAPEPIPLRLFTGHPDLLDEPLRTAATDTDALVDAVGVAVGFSLARRQSDGFQLHRLVQAAIRHQLAPEGRRTDEGQVLAMLAAAHPGDPNDVSNWGSYAQLAPHVLATSPWSDERADGRQLVLSLGHLLNIREDYGTSRLICAQFLGRWQQRLGPDHPDTLRAALSLTYALVELGEGEQARVQGQDCLERTWRTFGPDHPATLHWEALLAYILVQLGAREQARALGQHSLDRCRRVLSDRHTLSSAACLAYTPVELSKPARAPGEDNLERCQPVLPADHPDTLFSTAPLAYALAELGEHEQARTLGQDTLDRCRRVLGPDHPATLRLAVALAYAVVALGEHEQARTLGQDTLERCRRVLGPDHRHSLIVAAMLAYALAALGEHEQARTLGQDTLERCRRVPNPDHPVTVRSTAVLAYALQQAAEPAPAGPVGE